MVAAPSQPYKAFPQLSILCFSCPVLAFPQLPHDVTPRSSEHPRELRTPLLAVGPAFQGYKSSSSGSGALLSLLAAIIAPPRSESGELP